MGDASGGPGARAGAGKAGRGALAGVRVVEISSLVAAPYAGKLLGDFGADVVKVESPAGDPLRALDADLFDNLNTSKRGVVLDLDAPASSPEGDRARAALRQLVAKAEIVVEDLAPGRLAELLGGDPLVWRPSLVVASVTPFGQDGPRAGWKGGDLVGWAAGGMAYITGLPDQEPLAPAGLQAWHLAGLQAACGALYAFFHVQRSGVGQRVDTSVQEAVCTILEAAVSDWQMTRVARGRMGTLHPAAHGMGMQTLADGSTIFCSTMPRPTHWAKMRELLGDPEWMRDPRWEDIGVRRAHWQEIDRLAGESFSKLTLDDVYRPMLEAGVPVGLVSTMGDVAASPQLQARDFFVEVEGRTYLGAPFRMSGTPWRIQRPSPARPGEHDGEILAGAW